MQKNKKNKEAFVKPSMEIFISDSEDVIVTSTVTHTFSENGMSCSCGAFHIIGPDKDYWYNDKYEYHN